jgi:uncharacterized protein (TIGR02145 family)
MIQKIQKTRLALAFLLVANFVMAQAPQAMSYQSVIRNSSNVLLANTTVGMKISILQDSANGTPVYTETQTATTNANGLVSLQIGAGTADLMSITIPDSVTSIGNDAFTTGTFAGINWANGPYFIKTETDPAGGTNYTITGTQEMLSVPYALYAAKSGGLDTIYALIATQSAQIIALQNQISGLIQLSTLSTVVIGTQKWTTKNLNVTTYSNGDIIPEVQDGAAWANLTTGAWCHLNNDPANDAIYGKMYNHYAVEDPRGLAPVGYHIPTQTEWFALFDTAGGGDSCSPKLRSTVFNGTDDYGFSVLNGGARSGNAKEIFFPDEPMIPPGTFDTSAAMFWSSDVLPQYTGAYFADYNATGTSDFPNNYGAYIRLIKN